MLTAQRALTLNSISGGRFKLGLGVNHSTFTEELWGIPWDKPVRRMKEYLDGLLPLLDGKEADAVGKQSRPAARCKFPGCPPRGLPRRAGPANAASRGSAQWGTITWMTGPKTLADHIGPTLRDAAAAAGRPEGAVKVIAALPIRVTEDVDGARKLAAEEYSIYGTLPSYRAMLDREGFAGPEEIALIGDEATVTDRIDELRAAGVDEFIGSPFGDDEETIARSRGLLRKIAGPAD